MKKVWPTSVGRDRQALPCLRILWAVIAGALFACCLGQPGTTTRVSVGTAGLQGNGRSEGASISADGRYVAFQSSASNLIPVDTNGATDIFVRDRLTGETSCVSVTSLGNQGNDVSYFPSISGDGRFVAFQSYATNLIPGDTNGFDDIFVHDRATGETTNVSVSSSGEQGNNASVGAAISLDGRYVVFKSHASNLVPGHTNGAWDIFVHDRQTGETSRVSVSSSGDQGDNGSEWPSISADGRYIAFDSYASNLVPDDTNGHVDTFVRDRQTGETSRVSVSSAGQQGNPVQGSDSEGTSISADGRYVAFVSYAAELVPGDSNGFVDVFVHDRQTGQTSLVSVASTAQQSNNWSVQPSISADGRYVAFQSYASNLAPGDTNGTWDLFVHDRVTGKTSRVSVSSSGQQQQGNGGSLRASISADGRYVVFDSHGLHLVPDDTNDSNDVFVHEIGPEITVSGRVTFTMLDISAVPPSTAEFTTRDGQTKELIGSVEAYLDSFANFIFYAPDSPGSYELTCKRTHWLRAAKLFDTTNGDASGLVVELENGDANEDNRVDLLDLNWVFLTFAGPGPLGDLDEDGMVTLTDLNTVLVLFGTVGDE